MNINGIHGVTGWYVVRRMSSTSGPPGRSSPRNTVYDTSATSLDLEGYHRDWDLFWDCQVASIKEESPFNATMSFARMARHYHRYHTYKTIDLCVVMREHDTFKAALAIQGPSAPLSPRQVEWSRCLLAYSILAFPSFDDDGPCPSSRTEKDLDRFRLAVPLVHALKMGVTHDL